MRTVPPRASWSLGLCLGAALACPAYADGVKPAAPPPGPEVHRMEVWNGPTRTVRYFSLGLSPSDQSSLRELERAENENDYAEDLQTLRRRYVADEVALESRRRDVQQSLYGLNITQAGYAPLVNGPYNGPGFAYGYTGYGYGLGYGYYGGGYGSVLPAASTTVSRSLAYGIGDEGAFKAEMAHIVAGHATADYAASTARAYTAALSQAGQSEALAKGLNVPWRGAVAGFEPEIIEFKDGHKIEGVVMGEDGVWLVVKTGPKKTVRVKIDDIKMREATEK